MKLAAQNYLLVGFHPPLCPFAYRGLLIDQVELRSDILSTLSRYQDLFITRTELDHQPITRDATTLHTLNHIFKSAVFQC